MNNRSRPATSRDVARQARVHPSTVSRALDPDKAHLVNATTRERIFAAAEMLGYRPDLLASALRRGRTRTIGVVVADFSNPFYSPIIHGISDVVNDHGFVTVVAESREDHSRFESVLHNLVSRRVDAVITTAARRGDEAMLVSVPDNVPVVLAARMLPSSGLPAVGTDDRLGGSLAAQHLLEMGHEVLAQVRGPQDIETFVQRTHGFQLAVAEAGARLVPARSSADAPSVAEGRRLIAELLEADGTPAFTGIFAHNDLMALGAIEELANRGLRCPDDVSVVGYNDSIFAPYTCPPLTSVSLPAYEIGRESARLVLRFGEGSRQEEGGVTMMGPTHVVVRESTAPPSTPRQAAGAGKRLPASRHLSAHRHGRDPT